jgi:hypothetical protein
MMRFDHAALFWVLESFSAGSLFTHIWRSFLFIALFWRVFFCVSDNWTLNEKK